jgi:hypothetical protein
MSVFQQRLFKGCKKQTNKKVEYKMGNFYEMIAEMKENETITTTGHTFNIQKRMGVLKYVTDEGNVDTLHGNEGVVVQLDNMNRYDWKKAKKEEFVQLTDWNEIVQLFLDRETLYVDTTKEEANRWTPVDNFSIQDFDDIFRLTKFYKKVVR